ncbi:hypothetical protein HETIRDRAFT_423607 [Heterobasidion irregulare TC 32-1]|uniref:Uncharacterized protein n=1 Tax=Heterobasidion irregulare (strain TC 32-1) TaxID=747525 RepID=W4JNB0_HETIT|nr:uncharacterized protein HETIRDRAFT_423607 [Heterobasidion irregulare TC 32-1]ETW75028.1 hypothetical protein HETIRDRAFT_423607 [Heterobasidion irregulare TC 32-1]
MILGIASSFTLILLVVVAGHFRPSGVNSTLHFSDVVGAASTHQLIGTHTLLVLS